MEIKRGKRECFRDLHWKRRDGSRQIGVSGGTRPCLVGRKMESGNGGSYEIRRRPKKKSGLEGSQADGRNDPMMEKGILRKETKCDFVQTSIVCPNQQNAHNKVQFVSSNTHAILLTEQPLKAKELQKFA
ncbi:hypothetical protein RDWZM_010586 [Blomia tropicalis]|uniref:Uncharacterized protein n=1 Tax=Blomia tropicalis TaxID=40697 RepID=A0A9Q0RK91_BLOTA|nr:hypothetical protein RDWZM_010586 [Blomia tropicalis]